MCCYVYDFEGMVVVEAVVLSGCGRPYERPPARCRCHRCRHYHDDGVYIDVKAARPPPYIVLLLCAWCCVRTVRQRGVPGQPGHTHTHTHGDVLESLGLWANSAAGPTPPHRLKGGGPAAVMLGNRTADRAARPLKFSFAQFIFHFPNGNDAFSDRRRRSGSYCVRWTCHEHFILL